jgi:saccharopine dehydrogenase-like NADP-dependent oxidoreductase
MKRKILVLGAGKIGGAIVDLLHASGGYEITLADSNAGFLAQAGGTGAGGKKATTRQIDVADPKALADVAQGQDAVISALPFFLNPGVAQVCAEAGAHYFDLTEDVETTRAVREISKNSPIAFAPQCGLAPVSFPSSRITWRSGLTACARCTCASARCRNFRPTRSNTISPGRPTA